MNKGKINKWKKEKGNKGKASIVDRKLQQKIKAVMKKEKKEKCFRMAKSRKFCFNSALRFLSTLN